LSEDDIREIVKINLKRLPVRVTKKLVDFVSKNGYSKEYGARHLKRYIRQNLTLKIADKILSGEEDKIFKVLVSKGEIEVY
jgi:ATP-dependent Clp protease ATP-binding subunit ClpA